MESRRTEPGMPNVSRPRRGPRSRPVRLLIAAGATALAIVGLWLTPPMDALEPDPALPGIMAEVVDAGRAGELIGDAKVDARYNGTRDASADRQERRGHVRAGLGELVVELKRLKQSASTSLLQQLRDRFVPTLSAQTEYVYETEGYGIFDSWDDGDDSTWEGNVFVYHYETGISGSLDMQLDLTPLANENQPTIVWAEGEVEDEEGDPWPIMWDESVPGAASRALFNSRPSRSAPRVYKVVARRTCPCELLELPGSDVIDCMIENTLDASWNWCAAAAAGCSEAGAALFKCTGTVCLGVLLANFLDEVWSFRWECASYAGNAIALGASGVTCTIVAS